MINRFLWFKRLLLPLAWLYGSLMLLRRQLYKKGILNSYSLPGQVISIGNLEVGGTGKSPIVMYVAEQLIERGERPAILSRGYRSGLKTAESAALLNNQVIMPPQRSHDFRADEARMQSARLPTVPVIIGAKRWWAAQRYLQDNPPPTVWLLDDGFQHLKIKRDQDWLLLDETTSAGAFQVMPVGRLREIASTMTIAHRLIFTRANLNKPITDLQQEMVKAGRLCYRAAFSLGRPYQTGNKTVVSDPKSFSCGLATGVAKPQLLIENLQEQGWQISAQLIKGDHECFQPQELAHLAAACELILTTEKDYFRDKEIFTNLSRKVFILPLTVHLDRDLFL